MIKPQIALRLQGGALLLGQPSVLMRLSLLSFEAVDLNSKTTSHNRVTHIE